MLRVLKQILKRELQRLTAYLSFSSRDWENPGLILTARVLMASESWCALTQPLCLSDKEFRVYSQCGDDGIVQFLIKTLGIQDHSFIEFGVSDFFESNTHFLLVNNNWCGFVIDGSEANIRTVRNSSLYWRYSLQAESNFITVENINDLLDRSGFGKIGLLHIDLDGNDYWVLNSLELSRYQPDILILEYNSIFGAERAITVPYDPAFDRLSAHYTGSLFGASLPALVRLAGKKGYYFIGCNSSGNNAYFLREVYRDHIAPKDVREGFVEARFRDSRNSAGQLTYFDGARCRDLLRGMQVINVENGSSESF